MDFTYGVFRAGAALRLAGCSAGTGMGARGGERRNAPHKKEAPYKYGRFFWRKLRRNWANQLSLSAITTGSMSPLTVLSVSSACSSMQYVSPNSHANGLPSGWM